MDAISSFRILGFDHPLCSTTNTHIKINASVFSHSRSQFFKPNLGTQSTLPRLRISYLRNKALEQCFRWPRILCLLGNINDESKETELSSDDSQQEAAIDLKLPRRSLLVTFTCDACGTRSQRLINRLAYERGLVYVQCAGCSQYHKLVDNLGLVVEYNLQEQIDLSANTDQI